MKKTVFLFVLGIALILSVLSGFLISSKTPEVVPSAQTNTNQNKLSTLDFSLGLLKECQVKDENVLVSPLCASGCLTAAALGSSGNTKLQLSDVLVSGADISSLAASLGTALTENDCVLSVWLSNDGRLELSSEYSAQVKNTLSADIFSADFGTALDSINNWVKDSTDGRIESIIDDIPPESVMYILSAFTFDGEWVTPYTEDNVSEGLFTSSDGNVGNVEFMTSTENIYLETELSTGFAKPYTNGSCFIALLPNEGVSTAELVASLDSKTFTQMISSAEQKKVRVFLPKFKTSSRLSLSQAVINMGAPDAFSSKDADFSALGAKDGNVYISDFLQNCCLNVDELGTQGGAAAGVEVSIKSAPTVTVRLDRPFIYFILNGDELLFAGITERI